MQLERSRVEEAAPVVTGKSDDATANTVFHGWRASLPLQKRFNPFLELEQAKRLRDRVVRRFLIKPGHLIGVPDPAKREAYAQIELISDLIRRGWSQVFVERYLRVAIDAVFWRKMKEEAFA